MMGLLLFLSVGQLWLCYVYEGVMMKLLGCIVVCLLFIVVYVLWFLMMKCSVDCVCWWFGVILLGRISCSFVYSVVVMLVLFGSFGFFRIRMWCMVFFVLMMVLVCMISGCILLYFQMVGMMCGLGLCGISECSDFYSGVSCLLLSCVQYVLCFVCSVVDVMMVFYSLMKMWLFLILIGNVCMLVVSGLYIVLFECMLNLF